MSIAGSRLISNTATHVAPAGLGGAIWVDTSAQVSLSEDAFTGSTNTCDGQIKWDQAAQRFEYYSLDCAAAAGSNGFSFGWSKTASPTPLTGSSAAPSAGLSSGTFAS